MRTGRITFFTFIFFVFNLYGFAQTVKNDSIAKPVNDTLSVCNDSIPLNYVSADTLKFNDLMQKAKVDSISLKPINEIIMYVGRYLIGTPYGSPKRKRTDEDALLIGFEKFDCVTFVENTTALARTIKAGKTKFCDFAAELKNLRFRGGKMGKFSYRLHYFSEWVYDNQDRGIVSDMSGKIDTIPWNKKINFMTANKKKYPQLRDKKKFAEMKLVEKNLTARKRFYLPKEKLDDYKAQIHDGDVICFVVNTSGLDVSHTGFACWVDGELHFMHASSLNKKVEILKSPLKDYLTKVKKIIGITVARPL